MRTDKARANHQRKRGGPIASVLMAVCSVVVLGAAGIAVYSWSRAPSERTSIGYTQRGQLSYHAPAPSGSLYGSSGVRTGLPVYWKIVPGITLTYRYELTTAASATIRGTEQLVATVSNGQGVTRRVPLQAPTSFAGKHFVASASFTDATLGAVAAAFAQVAGPSTSPSYTVVISPHVKVQGRIGSAPLRAAFSPSATFSYSTTDLAPVASSSSSTSTAGARSGAGSTMEQFSASSSKSLLSPVDRPATLVGGVRVKSARVVSLAVLLAALVGLGYLARRRFVTSDDRLRIALRYSTLLVEAHAVPSTSGPEIALRAFDGLASVARRLESPIIHVRDDAGDLYAVVDNGTVYRYRSGGPDPSMMTPADLSGNGWHTLVSAVGPLDSTAGLEGFSPRGVDGDGHAGAPR